MDITVAGLSRQATAFVAGMLAIAASGLIQGVWIRLGLFAALAVAAASRRDRTFTATTISRLLFLATIAFGVASIGDLVAGPHVGKLFLIGGWSAAAYAFTVAPGFWNWRPAATPVRRSR